MTQGASAVTLTTKRVQKVVRTPVNGLETLVELAATVVLATGLIFELVLLVVFVIQSRSNESLQPAFWFWILLASLGTLLHAFVIWLVLRCLAEHLRLQKKIGGLPYEGTITGPKEELVWTCGNCGHRLRSMGQCDFCGAKIDDDQE
jgi:hypothetical protein